jgi:hypothetical protein
MEPPTTINYLWFYISIFGELPRIRTRWLIVMLIVCLAAYLRRLLAWRDLRADHLFKFLIAFGLPTLVFLVSACGPKNVFAPRQLLGAAIPFVTAIGLCLATMPRIVAAMILVAMVVWTAWSLPTTFPSNAKPPWRDLAEQIDTRFGSMIVVAQEEWVRQPLAYYRRAGSVRLWNELREDERCEKLLFLCRPNRCSLVESEANKSRLSLLEIYQWGRAGGIQSLISYIYMKFIMITDRTRSSVWRRPFKKYLDLVSFFP